MAAGATRRVWRAAPASLAVVGVFVVASGVGIPVVAYLIYRREGLLLIPVLLALLAVGALVYAWRFGLHPSIAADEFGVHVSNPRRRVSFPWDEITVIDSGQDGLIVASEQNRIEAWCVQESARAIRTGHLTRSDRIVEELGDLQDRFDPPLDDEESGVRIRRARADEAGLLTRLERTANESALRHIFPPERYPYPVAEVQQRWRSLLRDPLTNVRVLEHAEAPIGFIAYESAGLVRHLAIDPRQTRHGYGSLLLQFAVEEIFDAGAPEAELWVLTENTAARSFYAVRGWTSTDDVSESEFPPYPEEIRLRRRNPSAPRRGR